MYHNHLHLGSQTHACHVGNELGMQVNAVGMQSSTLTASSKHSRYQQNLLQSLNSLENMFTILRHMNL